MPKTRRKYKGNATATTISAGLSSGATSCVIGSGTGWPTSGPFYVVVDPGLSSEEKILVGSISGTTISSLTRGVDDTTDQNHAAGCSIYPVFTAVDADEANELTSTYANQGGIVYQGASTFAQLAIGTAAHVLKVNSGATAPEWGQVATAGITDSAVTTAKIADTNVTEAKIAGLAVTTAKIADGAVTEAKLDSSLPKGIVGEIKTISSNTATTNTTIPGTTMSSYTYATDRVYKLCWRGINIYNSNSTAKRGYTVKFYDGTTYYGETITWVDALTTVSVPDGCWLFVGDGSSKQWRLAQAGNSDLTISVSLGADVKFWVEDLGKL